MSLSPSAILASRQWPVLSRDWRPPPLCLSLSLTRSTTPSMLPSTFVFFFFFCLFIYFYLLPLYVPYHEPPDSCALQICFVGFLADKCTAPRCGGYIPFGVKGARWRGGSLITRRVGWQKQPLFRAAAVWGLLATIFARTGARRGGSFLGVGWCACVFVHVCVYISPRSKTSPGYDCRFSLLFEAHTSTHPPRLPDTPVEWRHRVGNCPTLAYSTPRVLAPEPFIIIPLFFFFVYLPTLSPLPTTTSITTLKIRQAASAEQKVN